MVSKITVFEPHFEGAQFGPASIRSGNEEEDSAAPATEDEVNTDGRSRVGALLVGGALLTMLLAVVVIRRTRNAEDEYEAKQPQEEEYATVEEYSTEERTTGAIE